VWLLINNIPGFTFLSIFHIIRFVSLIWYQIKIPLHLLHAPSMINHGFPKPKFLLNSTIRSHYQPFQSSLSPYWRKPSDCSCYFTSYWKKLLPMGKGNGSCLRNQEWRKIPLHWFCLSSNLWPFTWCLEVM